MPMLNAPALIVTQTAASCLRRLLAHTRAPLPGLLLLQEAAALSTAALASLQGLPTMTALLLVRM